MPIGKGPALSPLKKKKDNLNGPALSPCAVRPSSEVATAISVSVRVMQLSWKVGIKS